jgi:hypothetical protein
MTKHALAHAQPVNGLGDARPWRQWAKDNHVGQNFVWQAIAEGRLKIRRVGRRMLVLGEDGYAFLRSLPEGPGPKPAGFQKAAAE